MLLVGRSRDRIPVASVTGIFLVDTDKTMCPGVNSASKKWVPGIPLGVKAAGAWGWRPTTLVVPNVKKSRALTYPDPLGPSRRPVVGDLYLYLYSLKEKHRWKECHLKRMTLLKEWKNIFSKDKTVLAHTKANKYFPVSWCGKWIQLVHEINFFLPWTCIGQT